MYIMLKKITKIKFICRSQSFHGAPASTSTSIDIFDIFKKFKNNSIQISQNNIYTKYDFIKKIGLKK